MTVRASVAAICVRAARWRRQKLPRARVRIIVAGAVLTIAGTAGGEVPFG